MSEPFALTVGVATYDDYPGLYMTVQSLRLYHQEALRSAPCELVVVDNHAGSPHGKDTARLIGGWIKADFAAVQYIPFTGVVGTSAPRDLIFRASRAEAVLVLDSHVMLDAGSLSRLLAFYRAHPDCQDLLHGPMIYDDLKNANTHFDDKWRAEMWGTWGTDPRGEDPDGEPFEIPGCGLGLFSCRKAAWPGFPDGLEGFGGEEMCLHEKFRQLGRKTLCLPGLRWLHRFGRPDGVPYPLTRRNKVRNYLIWHKDLALSTDRLRQHFVGEVAMPAQEFDALYKEIYMDSPSQPAAAAATDKPGCDTCAERARQRQRELATAPEGKPLWQVTPEATLEDLFARASSEPSSMFAHLVRLKELASQSETVIELAMQEGVATIGLLAGQPTRLVTLGSPTGIMASVLRDRQGRTQFACLLPGDLETTKSAEGSAAALPECDLLVIDAVHSADALWDTITKYGPKSRRWIAIHDTTSFGEIGEGGRRPGVLHALRYWLRKNTEWSVLSHNPANNGLTVLTREPAEKKSLPGGWKMLGNLMKAVGQHLATGLHAADPELLDARLDTCATCEQRTDARCAVCGCFVEVKASWKSQDCPLAKWPASGAGLGWEPPVPPEPLPEWPKVAVLCPSYRRPRLLANTIAQFQAQDYPAEHRRLIILEDSGTLKSQSGDGWELVSEADRYPSLSAKYQKLMELAADADVIVIMEDDDLYLPWHISAHVAALRNAQWSKPTKIWSLYNTSTPFQENSAGRFHASIAARRNFVANLGGWADVMTANFDQVLMGKLQWAAKPADPLEVNPSPGYVFRWASTGVPHSQGFMKTPQDTSWWDEYAKAMAARPDDAPSVLTPALDAETEGVFRGFFALSPPSLTQA